MEQPKIEIVKVSSLKPNPGNPRTISRDKMDKLKKSIQDFPAMLRLRPIIVTDKGVTLGGNMRLQALKELKIATVPIIRASNLTKAQQKEFIIKDNVSYGEWDWDALGEWDMKELASWGLDIPGFVTNGQASEDNYTIPDEIKTDIKRGDLFHIGYHRLLCGDSTKPKDVAKLMNGELCDLVVTDPPYNVNYEGKTKDALTIQNDKMDDNNFYNFLLAFFIAFAEHTKQGGGWYVWHADSEGANFRNAMKDSGLLIKQCLIWVKNCMVMGRQDYQWRHEPCLYGWKEGAGHYFTPDRHHTTVIDDRVDYKKMSKKELLDIVQKMTTDGIPSTVLYHDKPSRNDVHPTMKPILLLAPLIENSSREGEIVADAFLGSGSTMVACHQLQRWCYGIEYDPKYCHVIIDRMVKLDPSLTVKKNGKPYTHKAQ